VVKIKEKSLKPAKELVRIKQKSFFAVAPLFGKIQKRHLNGKTRERLKVRYQEERKMESLVREDESKRE